MHEYSPDKSIVWINIPKNASSFISSHLKQLKWQDNPFEPLDDNLTYFVVLRDPFERWISAFVEDCKVIEHSNGSSSNRIAESVCQDNTWFLNFIFSEYRMSNQNKILKSLTMGFHTKLQIDFLPKNLHLERTTFFKCDNTLNFKLYHWLLGEGIKNSFIHLEPVNVTKDSLFYNKIVQYINDPINRDKKEALQEYLKPDYDYINSITFY
jgi:hypothetical protein